MKLCIVAGARPNFVKIEPIIRAIKKISIEYELIHTGQHYDWNMSKSFFEGLNIPEPSINLEMGSNSYASLGIMMSLFADILSRRRPDMVMVVGDVDSTLSCALVAAKEGIKVVHVESGCRSFDRSMPEEINRVLTDAISDYCFCNTYEDRGNLFDEGISVNEVFVTGNVMADTLLHYFPVVEKILTPHPPYILATFHRPSNVDDKKSLKSILDALSELSMMMPVIFPHHPRTGKNILQFDLEDSIGSQVMVFDPMNYLDFLAFLRKADLVITDSGGVQVEAVMLGTPCVTMRENTEHRFTLEEERNILVGNKKESILAGVHKMLKAPKQEVLQNELLDGRAAERIVDIIRKDHG